MDNKTPDAKGYFEALFHNSRVNACLQMDISGVIQCINPAFRLSFGYSDEDVCGKHFSILFTEEDKKNGKPYSEVEKVLRYGQADDKNFMVHKDGRVTWVSGESILIQHENGDKNLLKILQDIQEQKESEVSLSRANDFNENILNAIDDFVILLNRSKEVIKYNPAFSNLFQRAEAISFDNFTAFITQNRAAELVDKIEAVIKTGKPFAKETIELLTSSGERVFDLSCQAIFMGDAAQVVLLVGHDVTVQKRIDLEREDLMGFVAHELRNPLASILMSNDLIAYMVRKDELPDLNSLLEKNKKNIQRLNKMVAELYDATRLGGGSFILNKAPFDFDAMVAEAVETCRVLQPAFVFVIEGKSGITVTGDQYRLQQVVSNYLSNAIKYSNGHDSIIIRITTTQQSIVVAVEDKGTGIALEQIPFLFDRFFRAEKTHNLEGIGLGLYLCRRIVTAHGGRVWAESEEGRGSVFYFSLPVPG